jgi:hypothetical protein
MRNAAQRTQLFVVLTLSVAALLMAAALHAADPILFQRFIGGIHPLIAFGLAGLLAIGCLRWLLVGGWFVIHSRSTVADMFRPAAIAVLMALVTILVDLRVPFAADINVLPPESLLFYPAIAFLVEIVFHVLPLTVLLMILSSTLTGIPRSSLAWIAIVVVSLLEPIYQGLAMAGSTRFPLWAVAVVVANLTLFNLLQLSVFKRNDFVSMCAIRLVYYAIWHVGWGSIRLALL